MWIYRHISALVFNPQLLTDAHQPVHVVVVLFALFLVLFFCTFPLRPSRYTKQAETQEEEGAAKDEEEEEEEGGRDTAPNEWLRE